LFNSFLVKIKALEGTQINNVAEQIYKSIIEIIKQKNEYDFLKAFTVSTFLGYGRYKLDIEKGKIYFFRVTTLNKNLFALLSSIFFKKKILKENIQIENSIFLVKDILISGQQSKWAGSFNKEHIDCIFNNNDLDDILKIKFITPTFFKIGSKFYDEINSEILFNNLLKKFNKYSDYKIDKSCLEELKNINIKLENINKRIISLKRCKVQGFTGEITLDFKDIEQKIKKIAYILLKFSFYSGVGYKSERGFGQIIIL
jgi:CRISPR-associated endoribonuclease Cas6